MFLSMLVAWMIPDVPRSLREQLKKENMMLMEFLLNQDQEAHAKSHSPKRSNRCFPANIEIVVEAPPKEQEEEEANGGESSLEEVRGSSGSDPEISRSFKENEENGQDEQGVKGNDDSGAIEGDEKEKDLDVNGEDEKGETDKDAVEEKEDKDHRAEEEKEVKAVENFPVDLDSFMSELDLLGERRKLHVHFLFFTHTKKCPTCFTVIFPHG